jgi:hypothetical protein
MSKQDLAEILTQELRRAIGPRRELLCGSGVAEALATAIPERAQPAAAGFAGLPLGELTGIQIVTDERMEPGSFLLVSHGACKVDAEKGEVTHEGCVALVKGVLS